MFEVILATIYSIIYVLLFTVTITEITHKKYTDLEKRVKKEIPNYQKLLPKYELVNKIPDVEHRKKGVKYVNDARMLDFVKCADINRLLHGETTTITDTPIEYKTVLQLKKELKSEVNEKAKEYESMGYKREDALKEADKDMSKIFLKEIQQIHGTYNRKSGMIGTRNEQKFTDGIYAHEDTHAHFEKKSKALTETYNNLEKLKSDLSDDAILKNLEEKKNHLDESLSSKKNEIRDLEQIGWNMSEEERLEYNSLTDDADLIENSINVLNKEINKYNVNRIEAIKKANKEADRLSGKVKSIREVNEGFAHAIGDFYDGIDNKVSDKYDVESKLSPDKIRDAKKNSREFIRFLGPDASKKVVTEVMNDSYDKGDDAVKTLEQKKTDYFGDEGNIGMMGIFREMTANPKKYFEKKKKELYD